MIGYDFLSILELCGYAALAFWIIGSIALLIGVQKTGTEFRAKGYLRRPSGTRWFNFLLWNQYEHFENPSVRFYFGVAHFCLVGLLIVVMAVVALFGIELVLTHMSG